MIALLAALAAPALACPSLDAEVERATTAVVSGDFEVARGALDAARDSFACAAATPTQAARYWLAEGALAQLGGDAAAARAPFAAARSAAPDLFDDRFGPKVRTAWSTAAVDGAGTLLLEPPHPASLDGTPVTTWPAPVAATPHLVQVLGANGRVRYGKLVTIAPGEDALVETGLPAGPEPISEVAAPVEPKRGKSPAMLIVAGVAAAGAGAFAGAALAQNGPMDDAQDLDTLEGAYGRQQIFGWSSYGLMGVTALSVGMHFVLK